MSSCQETISSYVCTTRVRSNGKRKTYKTKYSCCYGTVRNPSGIGCTPAEVRSLSETLLSAGARSFAAAIQSNTATERMGKGNYTFFVPLDEVKTPEFAEENIVVVDEDAELLKNANQDPLENEIIRKRREIYSSHILDHIIPGIYMSGDLKDEMLIETEDSDAKIRINEYRIPQYVQTANCRRIMKSDQFTKEGVVHFIEGEMDPASKTLADILKSDARFSTFVKVMEDAGMTDTLEKPGQVTLFAPTNEAFEKLTATEREKILSGKGCVDSILKQHLLPNVICSTAVQARARTRTNAMSHVLLERKDNVLTVDGNPILRADVIGTNGIIHEIDSVLMPETAKSVIQVLEERNMTEFLNLLDQAVDQDGKSLNLRSTLEKLTNFTLFVPDNLAIKKFLEEQTEDPKRTENLLNVIYNHIAQPQLKATALRNGDVLSTIEGPGLRTQISQFESFLNILGSTKRATIQCVGLETYDIPVCGGVIHRVSSLLPKSVDSVWEVIMTDSSYSVFKQLLELTNLTETLKDKEESFTVFAPQNQAFYQLPEETLSEMMKEPEKALPVLKNHILPETVCCSSIEVTGFSLPVRKRTLNGSSVSLNSAIDGTRYVGGAKLMNCDKMAENGIVHGINKVLMPQATRIGPLPLFGMNRRVGLPGLEVVLFG
ncbi:hypothetical protein QYM36_002695 [Artemia franciscana]|nr:hypothetical protein QYM36_002695 [Artemia franciscana]